MYFFRSLSLLSMLFWAGVTSPAAEVKPTCLRVLPSKAESRLLGDNRSCITCLLYDDNQYKSAARLIRKYRKESKPYLDKWQKCWDAYQTGLNDPTTSPETIQTLFEKETQSLYVIYNLQRDLDYALLNLINDTQKKTMEKDLARVNEYLALMGLPCMSDCSNPIYYGLNALVYTESQYNQAKEIIQKGKAELEAIRQRLDLFKEEYDRIYDSPDFTHAKLEASVTNVRKAMLEQVQAERALNANLLKLLDQEQAKKMEALEARMQAFALLFVGPEKK